MREKKFVYWTRAKTSDQKENILLKELNSSKVAEQVLDKRLFEIQKKKFYRMVKVIENLNTKDLIVPQDFLILNTAFKKYKELFVGYRSVLRGPEDRLKTNRGNSSDSRRIRIELNPSEITTRNDMEPLILARKTLSHNRSPFMSELYSVKKNKRLIVTAGPTIRQEKSDSLSKVKRTQSTRQKRTGNLEVPSKSAWKKRSNEVLSDLLKDLKEIQAKKLKDSILAPPENGLNAPNFENQKLIKNGRIILSELKKSPYDLNSYIDQISNSKHLNSKAAFIFRSKMIRPSSMNNKNIQTEAQEKEKSSNSVSEDFNQIKNFKRPNRTQKSMDPLVGLDETQYKVYYYVVKDDKESLMMMGDQLNKKNINFGVGFLGGPLFIAVKNNNLDIVRFLLSKGANPNMKCKNGEIALHVACRSGRRDVYYDLSSWSRCSWILVQILRQIIFPAKILSRFLILLYIMIEHG